jgi:hypothetical protein
VKRFLSLDDYFLENVSENERSPFESNLYSYAGNDPVNESDPSGGKTCLQMMIMVGGDTTVDSDGKIHDGSWNELQMGISEASSESTFNQYARYGFDIWVSTGTHWMDTITFGGHSRGFTAICEWEFDFKGCIYLVFFVFK